MANVIQTENYKGYKIEISYMEDCDGNPRKIQDNLGEIVCASRKYNAVTDGKTFQYYEDMVLYVYNKVCEKNETEFKKSMVDKIAKVAEIVPINIYDHSVVNLYTGACRHDFDSSSIGYIFATKEKCKKWLSDAAFHCWRKSARKFFEEELKEFTSYLNGWMYEFNVYDKDGNEVDSCSVFYYIGAALDYAKDEIDSLTENDKDE